MKKHFFIPMPTKEDKRLVSFINKNGNYTFFKFDLSLQDFLKGLEVKYEFQDEIIQKFFLSGAIKDKKYIDYFNYLCDTDNYYLLKLHYDISIIDLGNKKYFYENCCTGISVGYNEKTGTIKFFDLSDNSNYCRMEVYEYRDLNEVQKNAIKIHN